jgi:hypothetical protein
MKSEEILELRINKQLDPDRSQLRRVLEAQVAYERMKTGRSMLVHLLAFVGVAIWLEATSPGLLPDDLRIFAVVLWGSFLFLTVWVAVEEYVLWRKFSAYLMTQKGGAAVPKH